MNSSLVDALDSWDHPNALTGARSVHRWARDAPDAVAVIDTQHCYTDANVALLIVKTVNYLEPPSLPPGAIVGIQCSSRYMTLVLILTCECLGAATVSFVASEERQERSARTLPFTLPRGKQRGDQQIAQRLAPDQRLHHRDRPNPGHRGRPQMPRFPARAGCARTHHQDLGDDEAAENHVQNQRHHLACHRHIEDHL